MNEELEKRITSLEKNMLYVLQCILRVSRFRPKQKRDAVKDAELMKRLSEEGVG